MTTTQNYTESDDSSLMEQNLWSARDSVKQGINPKTKKFRFYRFVDNNGLRDILENKRIKATNLYRSNDPMECLPAFQTLTEKSEYYRNRRGWDGLQAICFTTRMSNGNMWARYADDHKGACLVFDLDLEPNMAAQIERLGLGYGFFQYPVKIEEPKIIRPFQKHEVFLFKILYSEDREKIPQNTFNEDPEGTYSFLYKLLCKKDNSWEYENEYRLIYDSSELFKVHRDYYSYGLFSHLNGIILGFRNRLSERKIREKLGGKASSVFICRAAISMDKFLITASGYHDTNERGLLSW